MMIKKPGQLVHCFDNDQLMSQLEGLYGELYYPMPHMIIEIDREEGLEPTTQESETPKGQNRKSAVDDEGLRCHQASYVYLY